MPLARPLGQLDPVASKPSRAAWCGWCSCGGQIHFGGLKSFRGVNGTGTPRGLLDGGYPLWGVRRLLNPLSCKHATP